MTEQGFYGVAILNAQFEILSANSTFCKILGYPINTVKNLRVDQIIHPDFISEFSAATNQIAADEVDFAGLQSTCIKKNGDTLKVRLNLDKLLLQRHPNDSPSITLTLRDLDKDTSKSADNERSEWFLQKTFDTIDQGVTIYDSEFRLVAWNKRYESLELFPPEFLKRGIYLVDAYKAIAELGVFGPGDPEQQARDHIEALINRKIKPVEELMSLNNRKVEIHRYLMPEGGLVAVFSDITEQRIAEAQLRHAQKMDAVGQLTGGIAHDFNNILGIILGNIDLLDLQTVNNSDAQQRIDTIKHTARRAANLTRHLLAFSQTEATSQKTININRMIDNLRNLIVHSLTPQVELDFHFAEKLWLTEIDVSDFENALINLALNARDAMSGRGQLTIETNNCTLDESYCSLNPGAIPGDYVQLVVSDTGEGIPADQQDRIFEPFFTTKEKGKGTGLGLAMVFGFVKRSRGYIKVYSEPGIGTTLRIYLPRVEGEDQPIESADRTVTNLPRGTETLLVVDDEIDLAKIAQASLEALGYRVLTANSGQQALECLAREPSIDLLFSDVVMPGRINGYELAEQASAEHPTLKILLTSGYTEKAVAYNGQARFETNLLDKPYTQSTLARRIRQLLDDHNTGIRGITPTEAKSKPVSKPVEWNNELLIGVSPMDSDHRILFKLLKDFQQAASTGDRAVYMSTLDELQNLTRIHFQREEIVMTICNYPEKSNHVQVHELLLREVKKMRQKLSDETLDAMDLLTFLSDWWVDHINSMDRAFAPHCHANAKIIDRTLKQAGLSLS